MNAERLALPLVLVLLAGSAGPALGQTLDEQVDEAQAKAQTLAEDTRQDPQQAAANAADPSWQGAQANWTKAWACDTLHAADERAGEAGERALDCPAPGSARAGEEDEQQDSTARAEEAGADAERAARDGVAAIQAFLADTREEPEQAPQQAATLANRTLAIVDSLVQGALEAGKLGVQAVVLGAEGLATGAGYLAQPVVAGGQALADGAGTVANGAGSALKATAKAPMALADEAQAGLASLAEIVTDDPAEPVDADEQPAEDVGERAGERLDAPVELPT